MAAAFTPRTAIAPCIQGAFIARPAAPLQPQGHPFAFAAPPTFTIPTGGQPLPAPVRTHMENCFNTDFSDVRIHVSPQATMIGANAFTIGSRIVFAPGQYDPHSARGRQLLGHELAHVVQQRSGRVHNPFPARPTIIRDPRLEAEADHLGARAAHTVFRDFLGPGLPVRRGAIQRAALPVQDPDPTLTTGAPPPVAAMVAPPPPPGKMYFDTLIADEVAESVDVFFLLYKEGKFYASDNPGYVSYRARPINSPVAYQYCVMEFAFEVPEPDVDEDEKKVEPKKEIRPVVLISRGRHPTISGFKKVLYAGIVYFNMGDIVFWDNSSGHYRPPDEFRHQCPLPPDKFWSHTDQKREILAAKEVAGENNKNIAAILAKTHPGITKEMVTERRNYHKI